MPRVPNVCRKKIPDMPYIELKQTPPQANGQCGGLYINVIHVCIHDIYVCIYIYIYISHIYIYTHIHIDIHTYI